jgi:hypothetical protein
MQMSKLSFGGNPTANDRSTDVPSQACNSLAAPLPTSRQAATPPHLPQLPPPTIWHHVILIPLLLCAALSLPYCVEAIRLNILSNTDTSHPEGAVLLSIATTQRHGHPYQPITDSPYSLAPYGPLFYLLHAHGVWAHTCDLNANIRRSRSLTALALVLALIGAYVRSLQLRASPAAALTATIVAGLPVFMITWSSTTRPDTIACSIVVWALVAAHGDTPRQPLLTGALCALAVLVKPTTVAAPAAIALTYLLRRQTRHLLVFVAAIGAILAGVLLPISITSEQRVWMHMLTYNNNGTDVSHVLALVSVYVLDLWPWLLLSAIAVTYRRWRAPMSPHDRLYFVMVVVLCVASSCKVGADINYYLELALATPPFASIPLTAIARSAPQSFQRSLVAGAVVWGLCLGVNLSDYENLIAAIRLRDEGATRVISKVEATEGLVFCADAGIAIRANRRVLLADKFHASCLEHHGLIRLSTLESAISHQQFALVVSDMGFDRTLHGRSWWPGSLQEALSSKYSLHAIQDGYQFYRPRDAER